MRPTETKFKAKTNEIKMGQKNTSTFNAFHKKDLMKHFLFAAKNHILSETVFKIQMQRTRSKSARLENSVSGTRLLLLGKLLLKANHKINNSKITYFSK